MWPFQRNRNRIEKPTYVMEKVENLGISNLFYNKNIKDQDDLFIFLNFCVKIYIYIIFIDFLLMWQFSDA
jgi:hypothetical protein